MDILETDAFDRRQRRNMVSSIFLWYTLLFSAYEGKSLQSWFELISMGKVMTDLFLFHLFVSSCQSCALFFSLLPFFLSSALYFYLWTPDSPPSLVSAGVKSAPALLLAAVVLSWNGGQSVLGVAGGLIFSAVGDCCLIWPELFLHGKNPVCKGCKQRLDHFPGQIKEILSLTITAKSIL